MLITKKGKKRNVANGIHISQEFFTKRLRNVSVILKLGLFYHAYTDSLRRDFMHHLQSQK